MTTTDVSSDLTTEARELWEKSYQGEVFGEAYFDVLAKHTDDPERRAKVEALAALERCTKELLEPSMTRLGIAITADQAMLDAVANSTEFDYDAVVRALPPIASEYLAYYARLRELVGPEDVEVTDLLIAHELALELFARREINGETDTSLQPIKALPHVRL